MENIFLIIVVLVGMLLIFNIIHDIFYRTIAIDFDESFVKFALILLSILIFVLGLGTFKHVDYKFLNLFAVSLVLFLFLYKRLWGVYVEDKNISKILQYAYYINCFVFGVIAYSLN